MKEKIREIKEWAEKEIDFLLVESESTEETELYERILKVFNKTLLTNEPEKNLLAMNMILERMGKLLPLTPITEENADWILLPGTDNYYQSKRYPMLYKNENNYVDMDRCNIIDINCTKKEYISNNIARSFLDIINPITLPYFPDGKKFTIYIEFINNPITFKADKSTICIKAILTPYQQMININRYFTEENGDIKEVFINKEENKDG